YFRKVAGWMADIAEALSFAHDAGVVHRDIKPNNLILSDSGRVLITDFGLAKDLNEDPVTHTGQLMGTWRYMSPEQVRGEGAEVDRRTDIYSLGATLYELLVLQPAIPGGPDHEMLQRVLEHEPLAPRRINPNIPLDLEIICRKAMRKEAATRYQSAAELADDLRRFRSGEPIHARSSGLHLRALKYIRRHRFTVAVALIGVFLTTSVISTAAYLDAARRRIEDDNATTALMVLSAHKHLDAGDYAIATQVYSNVLARDSSLAYVHVLRALARGELGRLDKAAEDLDAVISLDPRRSGSYYQRGVLQLIRAQPAAAASDLRRALQLDAHHHGARIILHLCVTEFPETGLDAESMTLSWAADPEPAGGYLVALLEYFESGGDPSDAVSAAPTPGSRAVVCCAIAAHFARRGEQDQARTWYEKSIRANDTPNLVRLYCRKRLKELSGRE
ncbi:MAG: protein kinase, partial [Planctomycetes bacterium]|nr:protein kinase [Planctomycetota bacterium]